MPPETPMITTDAAQALNDHDLLIEVNTNVKNLTSTLHTYTSAANQTMQDHELRLRELEKLAPELQGAQQSQKRTMAIVSTIGGVIAVGISILSFVWR